jgi:VWFA-related protein
MGTTKRGARIGVAGIGGALLLAVICRIVSPLLGQQPTFSTDVQVVNVLATVRNKQGQIVHNLTKDDFSLQEDGRPQTIRYFAQMTDLPLTLGLLVDTSMSQARVLDEERTASYRFLDEVLREDKDLAFVIHFDKDVELLQDLTSSRHELQSALGLLELPEPDVMPGSRPGSGPARRPGGTLPGTWPGTGPGTGPFPIPSGGRGAVAGTILYDAVYLASSELMKKQQGRKALIILSDGVDTGSQKSFLSAIEAAQRTDTLVYSILFADDQAYRSSGGFGFPGGGVGGGRRGGGGGGMPRYPQQAPVDGKAILEKISRESGGRLFEVSRKQSIAQIYSALQEELRNQYSLGYSPDRPDFGTGYRRIRLVAKQKDLVVQSRDGYYADRPVD